MCDHLATSFRVGTASRARTTAFKCAGDSCGASRESSHIGRASGHAWHPRHWCRLHTCYPRCALLATQSSRRWGRLALHPASLSMPLERWFVRMRWMAVVACTMHLPWPRGGRATRMQESISMHAAAWRAVSGGFLAVSVFCCVHCPLLSALPRERSFPKAWAGYLALQCLVRGAIMSAQTERRAVRL